MNNQPKISVVTVCYNVADTIEATMLSVLNQTYPNVEYIVIDGGSKDGTVDIIKKYADRIAYWVSEPDKGIYDAMNKGIMAATGEWINFMNAGDSFYGTNTITQLFTNKFYDFDIIYGDTICVYRKYKLYAKPRDFSEFNYRDPIFHQSSFTRTSLLKITPFDIKFKIAGDYNFFYQQFKQGKAFCYIPIAISLFDTCDGISSNAVLKRLEENRIITGRKKDVFFVMENIRVHFKHKMKIFLEKILPDFAETLKIKNLLRNPRFTILGD